MKPVIFLPEASEPLKHKLNRLIELSQPNSTTSITHDLPKWRPDFFNVHKSQFWSELASQQQTDFLIQNSRYLLQEAICIEHAGIAYGHKMALSATTQEERHYYTCVAQEELQHLTWLRCFLNVSPVSDASSFAQMIAKIVAEENRKTALVLIQVLLEGWGIHYYGQLVTGTDHTEIKSVFERILKDESRHHGGGVILFQSYENLSIQDLKIPIQNLLDVIRIGPYQVASSLCQFLGFNTKQNIMRLLTSLDAESTAFEKLKVMERMLCKVFDSNCSKELCFSPYSIEKMANSILVSLSNRKTSNLSKEVDL